MTIPRIVFAADRHRATGAGLSGGHLLELLAVQRRSWPVGLVHLPGAEADAALEA